MSGGLAYIVHEYFTQSRFSGDAGVENGEEIEEGHSFLKSVTVCGYLIWEALLVQY